MKKVIIGLLMITLYAVAQPGQSKYQGRSGYQQSIIWNDLHKSLQDSIRNIVGDSASANITDSLNALTASNGVVYSGRNFSLETPADTTELKAITASAGTMVQLKQLSSGNSSGGGVFVWRSSGTPDTYNVFAGTGGYWVRQQTIVTFSDIDNRPSPSNGQLFMTDNTNNKGLQIYDGSNWQQIDILPTYTRDDFKHGNKDVGMQPFHWRHQGLRVVDTSNGAWNDSLLGFGFDVVWDQNARQYALMASACNENDTMQIGLWRGNNYLEWTEYSSNPVFTVGTSGEWDDEGVTFPQLHLENGTWYMFYVGFPSPGIEQGQSGIGIATSTQLQTGWSRYAGNPVVVADSVPWVVAVSPGGTHQVYKPELVKHKNKYYLFYNGGVYGSENIGYSVADNILGPYTHQQSAVITAAMTGSSQNADPDIHLIGNYYYMFFWGPSIKCYITSYDNFPGSWSSYGSLNFNPSGQVRPVLIRVDGQPLMFTYDANRKSINVFSSASLSDREGQSIFNWSREGNSRISQSVTPKDFGIYHISSTKSTGFTKMEGSSGWINKSYIRGSSTTFYGKFYIACPDSGGGGAYDVCIVRTDNGDTLMSAHNQTATSGREHSVNYIMDSAGDRAWGSNTFFQIKARVNSGTDRVFLLWYHFYLLRGGW